jgi:hypothetical protein
VTYTWSVFGNIISVTAPDGRKKRTHLGVFRRTTAFAASLVLSLVVVIGEQHLRHILMCYMEYYNAVRTHLSLGKDAPVGWLIQRTGRIQVRPVLGGLHHQYVRI